MQKQQKKKHAFTISHITTPKMVGEGCSWESHAIGIWRQNADDDEFFFFLFFLAFFQLFFEFFLHHSQVDLFCNAPTEF